MTVHYLEPRRPSGRRGFRMPGPHSPHSAVRAVGKTRLPGPNAQGARARARVARKSAQSRPKSAAGRVRIWFG